MTRANPTHIHPAACARQGGARAGRLMAMAGERMSSGAKVRLPGRFPI